MKNNPLHQQSPEDQSLKDGNLPGSALDSAVMGHIAAWELARDRGQALCVEELCQGNIALAQQVIQGLIRLGYQPELAEQSGKDNLHGKLNVDQPGQLVPGQFVGPYQIVRLLGQGGMGVVYAALDPTLDREIALKMMKPEMVALPTARARFMREARSAAALTHDHILPILHVGEFKGCPYIAMPLLGGETLSDRLNRGSLTAEELTQLCHEAASGLAAAHAAGLVHRDIKPSNLWLEQLDDQESASRWRVKVFDFGLA